MSAVCGVYLFKTYGIANAAVWLVSCPLPVEKTTGMYLIALKVDQNKEGMIKWKIGVMT